jgi:hypothetical protein
VAGAAAVVARERAVLGPLVELCVWMVTAPAMVLTFPDRGPWLARLGTVCGALGALLLAAGVLP